MNGDGITKWLQQGFCFYSKLDNRLGFYRKRVLITFGVILLAVLVAIGIALAIILPATNHKHKRKFI
jgi:hypothetical protein